jgi:hypothetical protein
VFIIWKQDFIELLLKLDEKSIYEAFKLKMSKVPNKLFRYQAFKSDSYQSFVRDNIYLSNPRNFNDPFDCLAYFNFDKSLFSYNKALTSTNESNLIEYFKEAMFYVIQAIQIGKSENEAYNELIESWVNSCNIGDGFKEKSIRTLKQLFIDEQKAKELAVSTGISDNLDKEFNSINDLDDFVNYIGEQYKQLLYNPNNETVFIQNVLANRIVNEFLSEKIKVCCFSEVYNSILMWSHYGNNHKGYCLEYNFKELDNENLMKNLVFPVIYQKKLYSELFAVKDFSVINPHSFLYYLIIKSIEWKYEKEWRLIDIDNQLANRQEPKVNIKPKAIYLGAKIPKEDRDNLIRTSKEKELRIYQMRMKDDAFELYAERYE